MGINHPLVAASLMKTRSVVLWRNLASSFVIHSSWKNYDSFFFSFRCNTMLSERSKII